MLYYLEFQNLNWVIKVDTDRVLIICKLRCSLVCLCKKFSGSFYSLKIKHNEHTKGGTLV